MIELDRGDCLIFTRAPRNLILDSVSCFHEDLPHAVERRSSLLRIFRDWPMTRYEDLGVERLHCIQHPNPRDAVAPAIFGNSSLKNTSLMYAIRSWGTNRMLSPFVCAEPK